MAADIKAYAFDPDKKLVYCLDNEKQLDLFDPQDGGTLHIASDVEKIGIAETGNLFYLAAGDLYMLDAGRETTLVSEDAGFLVVDGPAVYYGKCLGDGFFDLYSSFDGADFQLCVSGLAMDGGQYTDPRELVSALVEAASSGDKESVLAHDRFEEHQIQRLRHIGTDI